MMTQEFTLDYGIEHGGKLHCEGEMRLPTMEDVENALEETEADACRARIDRHTWARTITRLGTIPNEEITPELLATAVDSDYGILAEAEKTLRKKRKALKDDPQ